VPPAVAVDCPPIDVTTYMDRIVSNLQGLDFRLDRATGMYDAVALVQSGGKRLDNFRRDRSDNIRDAQQTREQLLNSRI
jgi:hypothetical protein